MLRSSQLSAYTDSGIAPPGVIHMDAHVTGNPIVAMCGASYQISRTLQHRVRTSEDLQRLPYHARPGEALLHALLDARPEFGYLDTTHLRDGTLIHVPPNDGGSFVIRGTEDALRVVQEVFDAVTAQYPIRTRRGSAQAPVEATRDALLRTLGDLCDQVDTVVQGTSMAFSIRGVRGGTLHVTPTTTDTDIDAFVMRDVRHGVSAHTARERARAMQRQRRHTRVVQVHADHVLGRLRLAAHQQRPPDAEEMAAVTGLVATVQEHINQHPMEDPRVAARLRAGLLALTGMATEHTAATCGAPDPGNPETIAGASLLLRLGTARSGHWTGEVPLDDPAVELRVEDDAPGMFSTQLRLDLDRAAATFGSHGLEGKALNTRMHVLTLDFLALAEHALYGQEQDLEPAADTALAP